MAIVLEENILNHISDKELIFRMYRELTKLNNSNNQKNNLIQKWANNLNGLFSKEDIWMANRYMKIFSTSLIIREMQIKTTLKSNLTLIRMAIIRKMENNTAVPQKIKNKITTWWSNSLSGYTLKRNKSRLLKRDL